MNSNPHFGVTGAAFAIRNDFQSFYSQLAHVDHQLACQKYYSNGEGSWPVRRLRLLILGLSVVKNSSRLLGRIAVNCATRNHHRETCNSCINRVLQRGCQTCDVADGMRSGT